jgi:hypothetical protein
VIHALRTVAALLAVGVGSIWLLQIHLAFIPVVWILACATFCVLWNEAVGYEEDDDD